MKNILSKVAKPKKDFYSHSYISLKNKYFFHSVGKAANSTVKHFLYTEELAGTGIKYKTVHDRLNSPLVSPYQLSESILEEVLFGEAYYRFTFVRNPFSRLLSCYLDRIQDINSAPYKELVRWSGVEDGHKFSFEEFVVIVCKQADHEQNNHWRLQYADAMCGLVKYDFIGKQESFNEDMMRVWKKIYPQSAVKDFSGINKSPSKTNSSKSLADYWDSHLVRLVAERYEKDFSCFGYHAAILG